MLSGKIMQLSPRSAQRLIKVTLKNSKEEPFTESKLKKFLHKPIENLPTPEQRRAAQEFKHNYNVNISDLQNRTKHVIIDQTVYWNLLGEGLKCEIGSC